MPAGRPRSSRPGPQPAGRRRSSEAVALVADADRLDARAAADAAREGSGVLYDSRERRQELAGRLIGLADAETVDARVRADTSQAKPATEAANSADGRTPRTRRSRSTTSRQRHRGLTR